MRSGLGEGMSLEFLVCRGSGRERKRERERREREKRERECVCVCVLTYLQVAHTHVHMHVCLCRNKNMRTSIPYHKLGVVLHLIQQLCHQLRRPHACLSVSVYACGWAGRVTVSREWGRLEHRSAGRDRGSRGSRIDDSSRVGGCRLACV